MKKIVSLLLVVVLALGMSTVAFAAATGKSGKILDWDPGLTAMAWDVEPANGVAGGVGTWKAELPVTSFTWDKDEWATDAGVRMSEAGKIKANVKVKSGKSYFDVAEIVKNDISGSSASGHAMLRAKSKDPILLTSDDEVYVEVEITLTANGKKNDNAVLSITGVYDPSSAGMIMTVDTDEEEGSTYDGQLVMPQGYNSKWIATLDADETITATTKLFQKRNFYIYAKTGDIKEEDAETVDAYGFDMVYNLTYSANAVASVQHINFQDLDGFYVYGSKSGAALKGKADVAKDLVLLGTTTDDLPLYSKYYLASKQVDLDIDDIIDEPDVNDVPVISDVTGGDGYLPNVNDNPGTGK